MNLAIFKNAKTKYAYDNKSKIYSVTVMLNGKPRIITLRVGEKFTEISLANLKGEVLEVFRQEEGKGVQVNLTKER